MKNKLVIAFLIIGAMGHLQCQLTNTQIGEKLDSILLEGNLLYRYEKAAWISIDRAREKNEVKKEFFSYLVYHQNDTVRTLILNKVSECIFELQFVFQFEKPIKEIVLTRTLSAKERKMVATKTKIINAIVEKKIPIGCPEGYGLNMILMPRDEGFKFYIITGANKSGVIPFGNDYLFLTDEDGNLQSWKKFHSRLIALESKGPDGKDVTEMIHSHLRSEPFISATDICTFMLYGSLCGQHSFQVYSPELKKMFRYRLDKNKLDIVEDF